MRDIAVLMSRVRFRVILPEGSRSVDSYILRRANIVWANGTRLLKYLKDTHAASDRDGITYFASQCCTEEQFQRSRDLVICLATDDTAPATLFVWAYSSIFRLFRIMMLQRKRESKKSFSRFIFEELISRRCNCHGSVKRIYDARTGNFSKKRTRAIEMKQAWNCPEFSNFCQYANPFKRYPFNV